MSVMAENKRYVVDDAGTLIDIQTRDTYDYVSDVCDVLNEKDKSIKILTNHNKEYVRSINILEDKLKKLKELEKENQELLKNKGEKIMTEDIFDEFFSKYNNNYIMSFFKYKDGICEINISEYNYPKSKFNLKDEMELQNFIKTINVLYDLCDDDCIRYDDEANTEYYKRDKIVSLVQEELNEQDRQLNLNKNSPVEHDRIMAKIEVLNKLQKKINEVIDMW